MAIEYGHNPESDKQLNAHYDSLLDDYIDAEDTDTTEIQYNQHRKLGSSYKKMIEAMDEIETAVTNPSEDPDVMESPMDDSSDAVNDPDILERLDKMFTPILVSQGFEKDIADQKNAELSEAAVLTEKNIIAFDDETRMSQLISVCALLLAQKKNTEQWQMFKKAAAIKKQSKINIQKEEYNDAKTLAQKYLLKVANTNNSSAARQAANELLPQTQH